MTRATLFTMVLGLLLLPTSAFASIKFQDNFDSENGGVGALNYTGFANWNVTGGSVDLIGNGSFDLLPGNGLYVDMDGTTGSAGTILSIDVLLNPGAYSLSYDLAGNHRNGASESVTATVETNLTSRTESLAQGSPFTTFTDYFTLLVPTTVNIQFSATGGDNIGMLLDNVVLQAVPEASSLIVWSMLGVACVFQLRRKYRSA